ncbi:MAG: hypothetical protein GKS06_11150 [Acidobacteria bacterium]|nr:hypothetical protein [Acidobacteriota bacterium]
MLAAYKGQIRRAMEQRWQPAPHINRIIATGIGCTLVYIALAIWLRPGDRPVEYNFVSENGAVTAASALALAAAGAFALTTAAAVLRSGMGAIWPWTLIAAGMSFLTIDEVAQIHERIGSRIPLGTDDTAFRNWNDAVVIGYGFVALAIAALILPNLLRFPRVVELFAAAMAFYLIHTIVDSTQSPPTPVSIIVEESAKLLTGATLATATFVASWTALCGLVPAGRGAPPQR